MIYDLLCMLCNLLYMPLMCHTCVCIFMCIMLFTAPASLSLCPTISDGCSGHPPSRGAG